MAKRETPARQNMFNIDLEALLMSELSPEGKNESETSTSDSCRPPKKLKKTAKDRKLLATWAEETNNDVTNVVQEEEIEGIFDVSEFFERVGNDFNKSLRVRKSRLGHFTDAVMSIHEKRITDMIKAHEGEIEDLKDQTVNKIEEELNKSKEEFNKLVHQENKLVRILEQQMKMLQKAAEAHVGWGENFRKLHQNFVQAFEDIRNKHKKEILELKRCLTTDMSDLQKKFLADSRKEEMQTMKKYLSSVYF